jgi:hypothetical protein
MMILGRRMLKIGLAVFLISSSTTAEELMKDNFESQPETRWSYFSDQVMGGISQGRVTFGSQDGESFAHMTGQVSTENNGGFIQLRRVIAKNSVDSAAGVYIKVRGNGQQYYLHLRTAGTLLPWQYYQASFASTSDWQTVRVPLSDFVRSGNWLSKAIRASSIRSIGIVAYGRDHSADLQIAEIGFY